MRILWTTTIASLDGPGRTLAALINQWTAPDTIVLCTVETATPSFRTEVPKGLEIHELRARGRLDMRLVGRFLRVCRDVRPNVVHTQLSRADWIGRPLAALRRTPVVSTIQNVHSRMHDAENSWPIARIGHALDRLTTPCVARFVAVSNGVRADLLRSGIKADRIAVIPNALDLTRCDRAASRATVRGQWGISPDEILIGTIGLLKPQKGLPFLIEAARICAARDPHVTFVHIGDGPLREALRVRVEEAGLGARFRWIERVPEPLAVLSGLDIFVMPSLWEGLPIALLEAMSARLACVGTRVSGIEDTIEDGVSGVLVPPADAAALADALSALASSPERRRALGDAARARVQTHFNATSMADAYARLYREVAPRVRPITPLLPEP